MKYDNKEILRVVNLSENATIDWVLGNYCNFKCSYCFPGCNSGTDRLPKINDGIKRNIQHIVNELKEAGKDKIVFNLSGGEPTMYHDFDNLAVFLRSLGSISLITNGSRTLNWWEKNVHLMDRVSLSYHSEFADIDHVIKVVDFLEGKVHLSLHVMVNNRLFDKCIAAYEIFEERYRHKRVGVELKLLRDPGTGRVRPYTEEESKVLDEVYVPQNKFTHARHQQTPVKRGIVARLEDDSVIPFRPISLKHLEGSWNGYKCVGPHEFLQIRMNGDVGKMSCGQEYTAKSNIFDDDFCDKFILPKKAVTCNQDMCGCIGLLLSGKEKP